MHCHARQFMKPILYLAALLFSLSFVGCKPKETTLSGQAFIVTRSGESIKLGLVEVLLVEKAPAKELIQKRQPAIEAEIAIRQSNYLTLKSDFENANSNCNAFLANSPTTKPHYLALKSRHESLQQDNSNLMIALASNDAYLKRLTDEMEQASRSMSDLDSDSVRTFSQKLEALENFRKQYKEWLNVKEPLIKKNDAEINQLSHELAQITSAALEQAKPLQEQLTATKSKFESAKAIYSEPYPKAETYLTGFSPTVFQKAPTDADGKFGFSYPQNKSLAVLAKAERLVGGKTEKYYWLVNAPAGVEKAQLFLSNNNLVYADPDGYFKIKPKSDLQ